MTQKFHGSKLGYYLSLVKVSSHKVKELVRNRANKIRVEIRNKTVLELYSLEVDS